MKVILLAGCKIFGKKRGYCEGKRRLCQKYDFAEEI